MLYAILCYNDEDAVWSRPKAEDDACMAALHTVERKLTAQGRLGPVARLMPTTAATTLRKGSELLVLDGPFAETKEQLLGFYIVDCEGLDQAVDAAKDLARAWPDTGSYEIRPLAVLRPTPDNFAPKGVAP